MMNRVFVTGRGHGMVGSRMVKLGWSALMSDVTDSVELDTEINRMKPNLIVHLAAKSGVDLCERPENQKITDMVNFMGAVNVFELAEKHSIPVVHISSDHIFSGDWWGSYQEDATDLKPKNHYGLQKLVAEAASSDFQNVKVVRTSTLIYKNRPSVEWQLDALQRGETIASPFFIWRSFMHVDHFVSSILHYADNFRDMPKVLHISGSKNISWWRLIKSYAGAYGYDSNKVIPRYRNSTIPGEAARPFRCGLSTLLSENLGFQQYDYVDAIKQDMSL